MSRLRDEVLPTELSVLSAELATIDTLRDDDRFLAPFSQRLMSKIGRSLARHNGRC